MTGARRPIAAGASRGHFVYIVRCVDGTLYTGYARDPAAREQAHNRGRGAKYTFGRRPVTLVHVERYRTKSRALKREIEIKKWPRMKKEALCVIPRRAR
jgi:putative endonuclease